VLVLYLNGTHYIYVCIYLCETHFYMYVFLLSNLISSAVVCFCSLFSVIPMFLFDLGWMGYGMAGMGRVGGVTPPTHLFFPDKVVCVAGSKPR
jgi:hypothetical protein